MEEFRKAQAEVEQKKEKPMSQKMFKVILLLTGSNNLLNSAPIYHNL